MIPQQQKPALYKPAILPEVLKELHEALVTVQGKPAQRQAALAVLKEYFSLFNPPGLRQDMWLLLAAALSSTEVAQLEDGIQRYNLIFFYEFTLLMMDRFICCMREE
jgi:hypothetical protein